jgi:transposase InsO family protein
MKANRQEFSVRQMASLFQVSTAGFYAYCKRIESQHSQDDKRLLSLIRDIFEQSRQTYGYRRIHSVLRDNGEECGKHRVSRLMRENGIKPKSKKKFKATTQSKHNKPIHANHLNREFNSQQKNERWVSDITYIWTNEGWLYLAVIMDLYSRKIIGWSMSARMKDELVLEALRMALFHRKIQANLLLHSDRGSQYTSDAVQQVLKQHDIQCSMSRKGNCWDNATMESFFHSMKTECVHHENYQTRDEAKRSIFDYIEVFYNRQRKHSYLGYQSPEQFELRNAA